MGNLQAVPVVGEVATAAECVGKGAAGTVCLWFGAEESAKSLFNGVAKSAENYCDVNLIVANLRIADAEKRGDGKLVDQLRKKQKEAWEGLIEDTVDGIPVVGHVKGIVHYATGDTAKGERCMINATKSLAQAGAAALTGGVGGPIVGGLIAATSGVAYDGLATGINSAVHEEFRPTGVVEDFTNASDANDIFDALVDPCREFAEGAHGRRTKRTKNLKVTPFEKIVGNLRTAGLIREFASTTEVMRNIQAGTYDFVRLPNGKFRVINHADRAKAAVDGGHVGHASLVEKGGTVIAAGEVDCQSGHFRVPLNILGKQMGASLPQSRVTFESPALRGLFSKMASNPALRTKKVIKFSECIVMLTPKSHDNLDSAHYVVGFHADNCVNLVAVTTESDAKAVYNVVDRNYARAVLDKQSGRITAHAGQTKQVNEVVLAAVVLVHLFQRSSLDRV